MKVREEWEGEGGGGGWGLGLKSTLVPNAPLLVWLVKLHLQIKKV